MVIELIRLDTPRNNDIVSDKLVVAGIGTGFEATINYRVSEGHDELNGWINAGGGTGEHGQFYKVINLEGLSFKSDRLFLDVFEASAKDGSDLHKTTVKVVFGPNIVPNYYGFRIHKVQSKENLSSIARVHGLSSYTLITRANPTINLDTLYPGQRLRIPIG